MTKTIYLELRRDGPQYAASCWEHDRIEAQTADGLQLGSDDTVAIPDPHPPHAEEAYSLGSLSQALIGFAATDLRVAFEERGQIAIGQHLYEQTLGRLIRYDGVQQADLRIITEDEHLARLPWPLLARKGHFLISTGWTISLITAVEGLADIELRPSPRMLVVAPQPADCPATDRDAHFNTLRRLLAKFDPRMAAADGLKIVHSWEDFHSAAHDFQFDVVYYYGHGAGTQNQSRLLFESGESGQSLERSMRDFAQALSQSQRPVRLAYLNCCQGDAGGLVGAGRQLAAVAPCVVTNRTVATIKAAKAQAIAFWDHVLLQGLDPRQAVARNYQHLGQLDLSSVHPHWFTPVIHANYDTWKAHPPKAIKQYDPHWRLKVDRVDQFGRLTLKVSDMLQERKPRALAFLWFGESGQGMTHFHERLETELQHKLNDAVAMAYPVAWPDYYADATEQRFSARAFEEKLLEAFRVDHLERICPSVRGDAGPGSVVVVLNHAHAHAKTVMDPIRLLDYLRWWHDHVLGQLDDEAHFFLLGFSFQTSNVRKFQDALSRCGYDTLMLPNMAVDVLHPLESIKRRDLVDFIQRHNIYIPAERREEHLDYVMERTKGRYEATLLELEKLVIEGFEEIAEGERPDSTETTQDLFGME